MTIASKFALSTYLLPLTLSATLLPSIIGKAQNPPPPEAGSGRVEREAVRTNKYVVVAANPLASAAGRDVLRRGGSAIDAAIAVQMVLTLVEPQSSGIGGGDFLVYYDAKTKKLLTIASFEKVLSLFQYQWHKTMRWFSKIASTTSLSIFSLLGSSVNQVQAASLDYAFIQYGCFYPRRYRNSRSPRRFIFMNFNFPKLYK